MRRVYGLAAETTKVKVVVAVWPEEPTVISGMEVPGLVAELAINVSKPEGFDSDSLYVADMPGGRPVMRKVAVSVGALMVTGTRTGVPLLETFTVLLLRETFKTMGGGAKAGWLPQEVRISAKQADARTQRAATQECAMVGGRDLVMGERTNGGDLAMGSLFIPGA
jgi:hypothetical protein